MSTGKDVTEFGKPIDAENRQQLERRTLITYLLLLATQLPLVGIYIRTIWSERPHYAALPLAFAAFGLFLFRRWPRQGEAKFFASLKSDIFLVGGAVLGIAASILLSPWFGFAAFLLLLASLLARTNDRLVFGTLLATLIPLVVLLQPPLAIDFDTVQGDISFQTWLEYGSTQLASDILDLALYPHNSSEYRLEFATHSFSSVALGTGFYSVFTVLVFTGIYIAAVRIPFFRGLLLMAAAVFWFMVFEAAELTICVIAMLSFENDLYSPGIGNSLLQSVALFATAVMTLLSERLIKFLFGPVDYQAIDENISYQNKICRFWNSAIAGVESSRIDINVKQEVAWAKKRNSPPEASTLFYMRGIVVLLGILFVWQIIGLAAAIRHPQNAELNLDSPASEVTSESPFEFPEGLEIKEYSASSVENASAWETNSFDWILQDDANRIFHVRLSFPFSGWHDFDYELQSRDWDREAPLQTLEFSDDGKLIPYIMAEYENTLVIHRILFNTQMDSFGDGFERPLLWTNPSYFANRTKERLGYRSRPRIFSGLSVNLTVYVDTIGPSNPESFQAAETLFKLTAKQLQASLQSGSFPQSFTEAN